jgi:hypothetical protein
LIKHRDDWSGPVDITTFAPYSVKTPEADLADILAADNPDIWRSNAPARGGDTGQMFQNIIAKALEIRDNNKGVAATKRAAPAKAAAVAKRRPAANTAKTAKTSKTMTTKTAKPAKKKKP